MVNRLSDLANYLNENSSPNWLKAALAEKQQAIIDALKKGESFTLTGPGGESVTISPKESAAAA